MRKNLVLLFAVFIIMILYPGISRAASTTAVLNPSQAVVGAQVTVTGISSADTWITVKSIDPAGSVVFFGGVKTDGSGNYSLSFKVPSTVKAGDTLTIVAGCGSNVATQSLGITAISPTATTNEAGSITATGATLNGTVNANNASTTVTFEYGTTISYGTSVTAAPSPVTGSMAAAVSYALSGLEPNTTYHYRVVGVNSAGTANGGDYTFTTLADLTYTIENLDNQTLTALITGYTSGSQETKSITITKTGTGDLAGLSVVLNGANAGSFTITDPAATTLDSSTPSTTFTIKANDGLAEGTYSATVTVSAANMTDAIFTVTQEVCQEKLDECFIATAAFGSKFDWPVTILRHFRDQYLLTNGPGTAFVNLYYKNSPPIAAIIAANQPLKMLVRVLLAPVIAGVYLIYHPMMLVVLVILLVTFVVIRRKRLLRKCA